MNFEQTNRSTFTSFSLVRYDDAHEAVHAQGIELSRMASSAVCLGRDRSCSKG